MVFCFATPLPSRNCSLALCFASKLLAFKNPLPLGISDDLPWAGCGFFLELHNNQYGSRKESEIIGVKNKRFVLTARGCKSTGIPDF